jgi:hypothetical protein
LGKAFRVTVDGHRGIGHQGIAPAGVGFSAIGFGFPRLKAEMSS